LRVQEITADLTRIIASAAGYKEESHEFTVIQNLVRAWRFQNYVPHFSVPPRAGEKSENAFLYDFDLPRQIRRLKFVIRKAADLGCFDQRSKETTSVGRVQRQWDYVDPNFQKQARNAISTVIRELSDVLRTFFERQRLLTSSVSPLDGSPAGAGAQGKLKPEHPLKEALGAMTALLFKPVGASPEGNPRC